MLPARLRKKELRGYGTQRPLSLPRPASGNNGARRRLRVPKRRPSKRRGRRVLRHKRQQYEGRGAKFRRFGPLADSGRMPQARSQSVPCAKQHILRLRSRDARPPRPRRKGRGGGRGNRVGLRRDRARARRGAGGVFVNAGGGRQLRRCVRLFQEVRDTEVRPRPRMRARRHSLHKKARRRKKSAPKTPRKSKSKCSPTARCAYP